MPQYFFFPPVLIDPKSYSAEKKDKERWLWESSTSDFVSWLSLGIIYEAILIFDLVYFQINPDKEVTYSWRLLFSISFENLSSFKI